MSEIPLDGEFAWGHELTHDVISDSLAPFLMVCDNLLQDFYQLFLEETR